jgi:hypothetical protein
MSLELLKKLRINIDKPLWLINIPADCLHLFDTLETKTTLRGGKTVPQLVFFAYDSNDFVHYLPILEPYIAHETLFWIFYPKKSGSITSDLIQMKPWGMVTDAGYRGQTSVSVNDDWTGMRFTNAPKTTTSICDLPMEERKAEGIDFIKRTVQLPADAQAEVDKFKGLSEVFYSMSFTNMKEAVLAIGDAKKPETRQRRILKLVDDLKQKSMVAKSKKS